MNADPSPKDDDLTLEERAEIEREYADYQKFIRDHVADGWVWDEKANTLTDPDDEALQYWINPHTYKIIMSRELADQIKERIKQAKQRGEIG